MKLKEFIEEYEDFEIKDIKSFVSLLKLKPDSIWDLKDGDTYYAIFNGEVAKGTWGLSFLAFDRRSVGSVFLTREEAEKELAYRKVKTLLRKYANDYEFNENAYNFYIALISDNKTSFAYGHDYFYCPDMIYFSTRDDAQRAIHEIGEERLLKDYFRVSTKRKVKIGIFLTKWPENEVG